MEKINKAIIIAAGEGTRLRPITLETPKPLVKVNGISLLDRTINALFRNGIEQIIIVAGYKAEQFHARYGSEPRIKILENREYKNGNNITSMYLAKDYLPGSIVLEADVMIYDEKILDPSIEKSCYIAAWNPSATEWVLDVDNNHINSCSKKSESREAYQLWGISLWTREDGKRLAGLIEKRYENREWDIFWDEVALTLDKDLFDIGIRIIKGTEIREIDTVAELAALDSSYEQYLV